MLSADSESGRRIVHFDEVMNNATSGPSVMEIVSRYTPLINASSNAARINWSGNLPAFPSIPDWVNAVPEKPRKFKSARAMRREDNKTRFSQRLEATRGR